MHRLAPLLLFSFALSAYPAAADDFVMIKGGVLRPTFGSTISSCSRGESPPAAKPVFFVEASALPRLRPTPLSTHPTPMKQTPQPVRLGLALFVAFASPVALHAQAVSAAPTAAQLAKYDTNKNGRLDPAETAAMQADEARARGAVASAPAGTTATGEETVQLSPFEVREANNGYYAANTMSGTRLNTKIEDLAASISVVTKQQMADFAMLDINDVFAYEANTEGTGNYTAFEVDRNGMVTDQIQNNPQGANRIRGIGSANIAVDNFASSGRVPIDPINIDAIEISRGPNSNIFGLGEGSGTVNMVASTANLNRASSVAEMRFDDLGGWRTSLDLNRPLLRGKLAVRASGVYQHEAYQQKPSGFETRRFNLMVRAQPFRHTSVRASFQSYHGVGTRASSVTPRDAVSWWRDIGRPTWDPITQAVTLGNVTTVTGATNPAGLGGKNFAQPMMVMDGGLKLWMISRMPAANATNGPNNTAGVNRLLETLPEPVRTGRPLFSTVPGISDRSLFNWEDINLAGPNSIKDQVETYTVTVEQTVLDTQRHKLAFQFAWQREDADRTNRNIIGQASATGASYYLYVDVNSRLLDGRTNPNFLRPYIGAGEPVTEEQPSNRDSYRTQGAYVLDFTGEKSWARWLGRHQLVGYYEERKTKTFRFRFRDVMLSDNPIYAPAGQPKGNQSSTNGFGVAPLATRGYYHFYVGDNQGQNVDYAPSGYAHGTYPFTWFNPALANGAGAWVTDQVQFGRAGITEGTAGNFSTLNLIKTKGGMINSGFWRDRVVVTLGQREDENRNRGQRPPVLQANGYEFDYAAMNGWAADPILTDGDPLWGFRSGKTTTKGVVARPFRGWNSLESAGRQGGVGGFAAQFLSGLQFHYNKSDSFRPETPAISILLQELPNPTSNQKEYGFSLNLWNNQLVFRANRYENNQVKSRAGQSAIFAQRTLRVDFASFAGNNDAISLQRQARNWLGPNGQGLTGAALETAVANLMGLTADQLAQFNNNTISETSDVRGKGDEYELNYNPRGNLTLRLNVTRQQAFDANLSPNIPAWIAQRMPVWNRIIDPRTGTLWLDTAYNGDLPGGTATPRAFLTNNVVSPLALVQATEGKARPQTREWRVNLIGSYRLTDFDNKHLKRMNVGGAIRWEDKGAIGYYGIPVNGDITLATQFDANRPIYDAARLYADAFVGYRTRILGDKVGARFQLNIRNLHESGRLQKIGAYPDGRGHTFRIINPRTFIFTTTFDL